MMEHLNRKLAELLEPNPRFPECYVTPDLRTVISSVGLWRRVAHFADDTRQPAQFDISMNVASVLFEAAVPRIAAKERCEDGEVFMRTHRFPDRWIARVEVDKSVIIRDDEEPARILKTLSHGVGQCRAEAERNAIADAPGIKEALDMQSDGERSE